MTWKLEFDGGAQNLTSLGLYLSRDPNTPVNVNLYSTTIMRNYSDKRYLRPGHLYFKGPKLRNHTINATDDDEGGGFGRGWGWSNIFDKSTMDVHLDNEGSLNLEVTAHFYVASDGIAEIELPVHKTEDKNKNGEMETRKSRNVILDQLASLLGDEVTSDVIVSVVDKEKDVERGKFFCHSAIIAGRSSNDYYK